MNIVLMEERTPDRMDLKRRTEIYKLVAEEKRTYNNNEMNVCIYDKSGLESVMLGASRQNVRTFEVRVAGGV